MPLYSHSRLSTYENCPQQYKLRYVDRITPPEGEEGIEAFLGSRVHETLDKLYKELILTKLNSLEELIVFYEEQWDKNWHENVVIVKKQFTKDNYQNAGKAGIASYYRRHHPFNQSKTLATEMPVFFKIEDYTIRGVIDRLSNGEEGVYEIHDYKTSGYIPSQDRLDDDRQLALYQIGIKEKFRDAQDVILKWHYLLFDKELTSSRSDDQLEDLKKQVISLIKTIEKDSVFKPVESKLCDWCEYPQYCPAKKHEMKVQDLPVNKYLKEEGVTIVNKYASTKAQMKELQLELDFIEEAAVDYAKREGVSKIMGSDFALRITEEKVLQFLRAGEDGRKELEEYVRKTGIWEEVSNLNLKRLARIVEDETIDKKIINGLLQFAEEVDKPNVRLVKKRGEEE
jgi:putative RecB family exonuclease